MVPGHGWWSEDAEREGDGGLEGGGSMFVGFLRLCSRTARILSVGGDRTGRSRRQCCPGLEAVSGLSVLAELSLPFQPRRDFGVDLASGNLVVRQPADRERLCGAKAACVLIYELVLEDLLELHKVHVHVLDINDNSPHFPAGDVQFHIPEFLMPGARFTLPNAEDADEGSNGLLSYSLSPSRHFRLDMGSRVDRKSTV